MDTTATAEYIANALKRLKEDFQNNQNTVEVVELNQFLQNFMELNNASNMFGIKLFDLSGEKYVPESSISDLIRNGYTIFEMRFPDGDKFEVVLRYRKNDTNVRSYRYLI